MFLNTQNKTALSSLFLLSLSGPVTAYTEIHDLYAGQHTRVGTVEVTTDTTTNLTKVTYTTISNWCLGATHLYVGAQPPASGAPGQFPYQHNLGCVQSDTYEFSTPLPVYMAAHAEVTHWQLPVGGEMDIKAFRDDQTTGYFTMGFNTDGTLGTAPGWCVDLEGHIALNKDYLGCDVFSSLDPNAPVDKPENLDLVNYVLNTDYAALGIAGITKKELQAAIWFLIDDQSITSPTAGVKWDQDIVNAMLADAYLNGEGFVPGAEDVIAFLAKCGGNIQIVAIVVNFGDVMLGSETAWVIDGSLFPNSKGKPTGWGTYFKYPAY